MMPQTNTRAAAVARLMSSNCVGWVSEDGGGQGDGSGLASLFPPQELPSVEL